ncbi:division/cell wall cluster transcriptional repressor MraZ [Myceligenerans salitolerans]|uniref:division/cell wall cluster transcriptional repressor MraZ n=1 Tax=Myceligenerans salitolerans TaxID=1230528 RepID=UPI0027DBE999|nr:division/cell wall cluster transcriptional repressor MraZ [Myceligenerans salitolerans]
MDSTTSGVPDATFTGPGLLLGTFTPKLDEKGRLILPAKFRGRLAGGLVMTRGQDRCLFLLPMDEFSRIYEQVRSAPVTSQQARDYLRMFLSSASDEVPDKQGRVSIPAPLREYAGLGRDVVVIGVGTRVEVWDAEAWAAYSEEKEAGYAEIAEAISDLGI